MQITKIESVGKTRSRIWLDGEPAFVLYKKEAERFGLLEEGELTRETYEQILKEILWKRSRLYCMNLLKSMDRTEWQLRQKLSQNGYPREVIEQAIDYVKGWGYVDDAAYARKYVECHRGKKSSMQMRQDLIRKGVARERICQALEEAGDAEETEAILKWIDKKGMDLNKATLQEQQRLYMFLLRKGFSSGNVGKVFKRTRKFHETDTIT